ncbi:MAG: S8 family serine peptidase [Verrucomicrobia bacterium]|nr:S8 family serine peptidase [Verrucomicrobiota bacterium]MCH8512406.1 S8 family serine peptidase [Kiritimatiellia bacterium]
MHRSRVFFFLSLVCLVLIGTRYWGYEGAERSAPSEKHGQTETALPEDAASDPSTDRPTGDIASASNATNEGEDATPGVPQNARATSDGESEGHAPGKNDVKTAEDQAAVVAAAAGQFPVQRDSKPEFVRWANDLPEASAGVWTRFHEEFPDVDPTEVQELHRALQEKRETFGWELTEETAAIHHEWLLTMETMAREMVLARAEALGLSVSGMDAEGRGYWLAGFEEGRPHYIYTANVQAAISTNANLLRMNPSFDPLVGDGIGGDGLYVNVNDHGTIYEHTEFQLPDNQGSRIVVTQVNDSGDRNHMTHVAGTVAAWGYNENLTGMAPRAWIRSLIQQNNSHVTAYGMMFPGQTHQSDNPVTGDPQMRSVMGTTSLGATTSNQGLYTFTARSFDQVLFDHPYYIHFYAASNDGSGLSTLGQDRPVSKNAVTIGSVSDVNRDAEGKYVSGGNISGFSSRGPTYDGRIKPDFTANGAGVTSTTGTGGSGSRQGTSMATPNASGSTVLLVDYFRQRFPGHFPRAATLKALMANTADDRGNAGPDYTYGWGIINVHRAAEIIKRAADTPSSRVLTEDTLLNGESWSGAYTYDGSGPMRVTIAWHDPPGETQSTGDRTPRLINDLDLRVIGPGGETHEPWVMPFVIGQGGTEAYSDSLRNTPATTGDNFTDNIEQVYIAAPVNGVYTVQINHKGNLSGGSQRYSLAVSGAAQTDPLSPQITSVSPEEGDGSDHFSLTVNGSDFVVGSSVRLRRPGSGESHAYAHLLSQNQIVCRVNTSELDKGYWDVVVRTPDGAEAILPNGFLLPISGGGSGPVTLYSNNFETATGLTLTGNWAVGPPNQGSQGGPNQAWAGDNVLGTYLNGAYENNINITATLPPFSTINRSDIQLTFHRWLGVAFNQSGNPATRHKDSARIRYSLDGTTWTEIFWENTSAIHETRWGSVNYALPAAVEGHPQVFIRFQLETDESQTSYGWNIDNLVISAIASQANLALPPIFTSTPPDEALEIGGDDFHYDIVTSDADTPADELVLGAVDLPAWLTLVDAGDGIATLSGTPVDVGSHAVLLSVTDGDYITYQEFEILVFPEGGNTPPVILTESLPEAFISHAYHALIEAIDAEGMNISLSTGPRPAWLSFLDNGDGTGNLLGTPPPGSLGTTPITLIADDGLESSEVTLDLLVRPRAVVGLTQTAFTVNEGDGSVTLEVARSVTDVGEVTVQYATANGTAVAGEDYVATSGTLTWADGELGVKSISIPIIDDDIREIDEQFTLNLSGLTGIADLDAASAAITIIDNDTPPGVPLDVGDLYLIEHGSASHADGVYTLSRTGDPANAFQGYVFHMDPVELLEVGDFVEVSFRIRANSGNNSARQVSWGFLEGPMVSGDGQTQLTDDWEGYVHQIGTRSGAGTTGMGVYRQGAGATGVMDHVGGGTQLNGDNATSNISAMHQSQLNLIRFKVLRASNTQIRVISTFPSPDSDRSNSGSGGGIQWNYNTTGGQTVLQSNHSLANGPIQFGGVAIASRGNDWILQDIQISSNAGLDLEPTAPIILQQPESLSVAEGAPAGFSVSASGFPAPAYQWRKNGDDLPGETASTLNFPAATLENEGEYDVVVSNSEGTVESAVATLTITGPPPMIEFTRPLETPAHIPAGMGLIVEGVVTRQDSSESIDALMNWSVVSKPSGANVTFDPPDHIHTAVRFDAPGVYELRLEATYDGATAFGDLTIHVGTETAYAMPPDALALWLRLDESEGGEARDDSPHQRHVPLSGNPAWLPEGGAIGGALSFTASGQHGDIPDSSALHGESQMSWVMWLKPSANNNNVRGIMSKRLNTSDQRSWAMFLHTGNSFNIDIGSNRHTTSGSVPAGEWTHVAAVFDGTLPQSERVKIYFNGELVYTGSESNATVPQGTTGATFGILAGNSDNFRGEIDEVAIYQGRSLSSEDIDAIQSGEGGNLGPAVTLTGPDTVSAEETVIFNVVIEDDGLPDPPGNIVTQWHAVNGPATPEFADPFDPSSEITFPVAGAYVIRLSADDSEIKTFAEWTLYVESTDLFARVNFQPDTTTPPQGWLPDTGLAFGDRGNGFSYGWNADNLATRHRSGTASVEYLTLNHMQQNGSFTWEIEVPNGDYQVRIVSGDAQHFDSIYRISAEGILVVDGTPDSNNPWIEGIQVITVTDGRLTLENADGAQNNKISFVEIHTMPDSGGFVDSNNNGVDDAWEMEHFGNLTTEWVEINGKLYPIYDVFVWGLNEPTEQVFLMDGMSFKAVTGRVYDVQYKDDLLDDTSWQTLPGHQDLTVESPGPISIQDPASPDYRIYRVQVRLPD